VDGNLYIGGFVGLNFGTIGDSYSTDVVNGEKIIGGFVGYNKGIISSSYSTGAINGKEKVGKFVGINKGTVSDIYSTGIVTIGVWGIIKEVRDIIKGVFIKEVWDIIGRIFLAIFVIIFAIILILIGIDKFIGIDKVVTKIYSIAIKMKLCSPLNSWSESADTTWYNSRKRTFTITTAEQLAGFAKLVNSGKKFKGKTVQLGCNISLNDTTNWENWNKKHPAKKWIPIGNDKNLFSGVFNGNGYFVSGVYINHSYINPSEDDQGLFGRSDGSISNLGVIDSYIEGNGGLVGYNYGGIYRSYFTGTIVGRYGNVGGLVGYNCGIIDRSYSIGTVTSRSATYTGVGGLVGNNDGAINNSYSASIVAGKGNKVCGLVGDNHGRISNSYYNKEISGRSDIGKGKGKTTAEMQSKEFVDSLNFLLDPRSKNAWIYSANKYPTLNNQIDTKIDIKSFFESGDGTEENPYIIKNKEQLENFSSLVNEVYFTDEYFKLEANIILNDITNWQDWANNPPANEWIPIGQPFFPFWGTFDGNGFIISGMYINNSDGYQGLFGTNRGIIKKLGVVDSYIKGSCNVGGIVGLNCGYIKDSYYTGVTIGEGGVGGLVGKNGKNYSYGERGVHGFGSIDKSYSTATVTGEVGVGGLCGGNDYGDIKSSYSIGAVTGKNEVGGLVGSNSGTVSDSYSVSKVVGKLIGIVRFFKNSQYNDFGGLVGKLFYGKVNNSFYDKKISGQNDTGKGEGKTTEEMELIKQAFKTESTRTRMQAEEEVKEEI
jgi:hypothetical protein